MYKKYVIELDEDVSMKFTYNKAILSLVFPWTQGHEYDNRGETK